MRVSEKKAELELKAFLSAALAAIESRSIRAWASSEHNAPIVLEMAKAAVAKKSKPEALAAYLVCLAMG